MQKQTKLITALIFIFLIALILTQIAESTDRISENRRNEQIFIQEISFLKTQNIALEYELKEAQNLEDVLSDASYIGEFDISYYTAGIESTGKNLGDKGYGITKSGELVKENYTASTDWSILPKGTIFYIEGVGIRVSTDEGGGVKGERVDSFEPDLETALKNGRHMAGIYVIEWGGM